MKHITADIVILGLGIGGYQVYKQLKKRVPDANIVIVDAHTYYTFVPMLHEVATGSVAPSHVAVPIREIIAGTPHTFVHARVTNIDTEKKCVYTTDGTISYAYAVVSMGSTTNYFGVPGGEQYSYDIRTLPSALKLHDAIMCALEDKDSDTINISVVGGGYTGVEFAGQLGDIAYHAVPRLYPTKQIIINIFNHGELLSNMPQKN